MKELEFNFDQEECDKSQEDINEEANKEFTGGGESMANMADDIITCHREGQTKQPKRDTFEILNDEQICYAVGVSFIKSVATRETVKEYYVIIHNTDLTEKERKKYRFSESTIGTQNVFEKTLNRTEKNIFKNKQDLYVKVQHNKDGRVYELKENSFSKYYESKPKYQWKYDDQGLKLSK